MLFDYELLSYCKKTMQTTNKLDRSRGSLIGGAIGDAFGYPVEFMSLTTILRHYGERGITKYDLGDNGIAEFSDDTQMSLFTAEGLLSAIASEVYYEKEILPYITTAYEHWYYTQSASPLKMKRSWLTHIRSLWSRRAPGNTCMSALSNILMTNSQPVINNSKGCGGVMRVAPIGIFSGAHQKILQLDHAGYLAGYAAEITHKHPLSTYASMALAMIVTDCISHDKIDRDKFWFIVIDRVFKLLGLRYDDEYFHQLKALVLKAFELALSNLSDFDAIRQLGEGWVAEETLAIALFSVMRYIDDFEQCVVCAVNHDGDSDSTGAVAGNIIGAILGYEAIPQKFKNNLELHDLLLSVAADLADASSSEEMEARYVRHQPYNVNPQYLLD